MSPAFFMWSGPLIIIAALVYVPAYRFYAAFASQIYTRGIYAGEKG